MTEVVRSLSLGRAGEEAWRELEGAYQLEPAIGRALVVSDSAEVIAELRRRMDSRGPLRRLRPGPTTIGELTALAETTPPPIVWIEADDGEDERAWAQALIGLNRGRDQLGALFLVLAGDSAMHALLREQAPDLAHVLSPAHVYDGDAVGPIVTPQRPISWLHISDLHLRDRDWAQEEVLDAFMRDLRGLLERSERRSPDLLFVTGDIAYSGQTNQYERAQAFLTELHGQLGLDVGRVFVVPGNHDVDRGAIGKTEHAAKAHVLSLDPERRLRLVNDILDDEAELAKFGGRLEAWSTFTRQLLGPHRSVSPERPFRTDVVEVAGLRVGVASLCSAWLSGPEPGTHEQKGQVVVGGRQLRAAIAELDRRSPQLRIALVHHPLGWVEDVEMNELEHLVRENFELVLHGHQHQRDARTDFDGSRGALQMGAGALYEPHGDRWRAFLVGQLDAAAGRVEVDAYTWSSHGSGGWHTDTSFDKDSGTHRRTFEGLRIPGAGSASDPSASSTQALWLRLRQALRSDDAIPSAGLPPQARVVSARLGDLYVEPRLSDERGNREDLAVWRERWLRGDWRGEPAPRVVILGGPGAGKSILSKHLSMAVAAGDSDKLPLLIRARAWIEAGLDGSVLDWAAKTIDERTGTGVEPQLLRTWCEEGRGVVLIDGIDEGEQGPRERLVRKIEGFAESFSRVPVIVTSREDGYEMAALSHSTFAHLRVEPFDDEQLRALLRGWYQLVGQPERAELLIDALSSNAAAKLLAQTPLLATLIAALHYAHRTLPGRRAQLYEQCLELLVDTWPEQRQRTLAELPADWQLDVGLPGLARHMQRRRARAGEGELLFERDSLLEWMRALVDSHLDQTPRVVKRVAEQWVGWLLDAGVLREDRHNLCSFAHRSFMEYLAGQGVLRRMRESGGVSPEALAAFALDHMQSWWLETTTLMLGSLVDARTLCDETVDAIIAGSTGPINGDLLLALFVEEVPTPTVERVDRMLGPITRWAHTQGQRYWSSYRKVVTQLLEHGRRYAQPLRAWFDVQLGKRRGRDLAKVLAVLPGGYPSTTMDARGDDELELIELLEIDRTDPWGKWAVERADQPTRLEWVERCPPRGGWAHALANLVEDCGCAAWVVGLWRRVQWLGEHVEPGLGSSEWRAGPACCEIHAAAALSCRRSSPPRPALPADETAYWDLGLQIQIGLGQLPNQDAIWKRFDRLGVTRWVVANRGRYDSFMTALATLTQGAGPGLHVTAHHAESNLIPVRPRPDAPSGYPWTLPGDPSKGFELSWPLALVTFATIETGSRACRDPLGIGSPAAPQFSEAYAQNLWLNLRFDSLVALATASGVQRLSPELHALLLALGLVQFQTTWRWPCGEVWPQWFAVAPPEHWLAAHVWHLCWAAAEPGTSAHVERAHEQLAHSDWPELAAALATFAFEFGAPPGGASSSDAAPAGTPDPRAR